MITVRRICPDAFFEYISRQEIRGGEVISELARRLAIEDADVLDAAASIATLHHSLTEDESAIRSLLTILALQSQLTLEIGGNPQKIVDEFGHLAFEQARLRGDAIRAI